MGSFDTNNISEDNSLLVPKIPAGVSGTALAASLLRDGWSVSCIVIIICFHLFHILSVQI